jgi:hypothetical protein
VGFFGKKKAGSSSALREMPVAPGVGKLHAHAHSGKAAIRFDTLKGPPPEAAFQRLMGLSASQAAALAARAWEQGAKFRAYTVRPPDTAPPGMEANVRVVKRLDLGDRLSVLAIESEVGGALGRAVPVYWTDLTHTCEPTWAKRFSDHLGSWIEANVDAPNGSIPLGFAAADFAWYGDTYLRGAAMPLEVAAVAEAYRGVPPPKEETVRAVVYPGGKASDPDEFDLLGTVLTATEAQFEGGRAFIVKLQVAPLEWIDVWVHSSHMGRVPKPGEGVEARCRLFAMWAGQRTEDLAVG